MKKYLFFLILLFSINNSFSQDFSNKITGSWVFKGYMGKKQVIECPDILIFEKGIYSILNECYGEDIKYPVIEKGKWAFDTKKNAIILTQRKLSTNYNFHGTAKTLTLYIKENNNKLMKVCFDNINSSTVAIFEKKR